MCVCVCISYFILIIYIYVYTCSFRLRLKFSSILFKINSERKIWKLSLMMHDNKNTLDWSLLLLQIAYWRYHQTIWELLLWYRVFSAINARINAVTQHSWRSVISRDRFCSFCKTLWSIKCRPEFERTFISTLRKTRYRSNSRLISHVSAKSRNRQSHIGIRWSEWRRNFMPWTLIDKQLDKQLIVSPIDWRVWDCSKTTTRSMKNILR